MLKPIGSGVVCSGGIGTVIWVTSLRILVRLQNGNVVKYHIEEYGSSWS